MESVEWGWRIVIEKVDCRGEEMKSDESGVGLEVGMAAIQTGIKTCRSLYDSFKRNSNCYTLMFSRSSRSMVVSTISPEVALQIGIW